MAVRLESGYRVAEESELEDLKRRLYSDISGLRSEISSEVNSVRREVHSLENSINQQLGSVSTHINNAASQINNVANSVRIITENVSDSLNQNLLSSIDEYTRTVTSAMESLEIQIRNLAAALNEDNRNIIKPAFGDLSGKISTLEDTARELNRQLLEEHDHIGETLASQINEEKKILQIINHTSGSLISVITRTNQLVLSLDKTFDGYQKDSLNRTRIRELIEAESFLDTAKKELVSQNWSRALKMFSEAEKRLPKDDIRPAIGIASAKIGLGELAAAKEILEKANSKKPDNPTLIGMLVRLYIALAEMSKAEELLNRHIITGNEGKSKIVKPSLDGSYFYKLLGVVYYHTNRVEEALANFRKAKEKDLFHDPELHAIMLRLGETEERMPGLLGEGEKIIEEKQA